MLEPDFLEQLEGVVVTGNIAASSDSANTVQMTPPKLTVAGPLRHTHDIQVDDYSYLASCTHQTAKVCIPSPTMVHFRGGRAGIDITAYPDLELFFADLAECYRRELSSLYMAGCWLNSLVGFSYGGAVVTGALRHIGDRVRHLVYLDAFVPAHGESIDALRGASGESRIELGDDWQIAPRPREFDDPAEGAWQLARRVAQPAGTFSEAVGLDHPLEEWPFTRTYIKATADPNDADGSGAFWQAAIRAKASPFWRYEEVATNHLVPANRPAELVAILTSLTPTG